MTDENAAYPGSVSGKPRTLEPLHITGERRFSPSIGRNRDVVRDAFLAHVRQDASVLEVGSGTGEHGAYITRAAPDLTWTFTDYNPDALGSIKAWMDHEARAGLHGPFQIDASTEDWGRGIETQRYDTIFSANVIHISPISVLYGIFQGADRLLHPDGKLIFYGPFARHGEMAEGNQRFDADLKRRDERWGVRDADLDLLPLAAKLGLELTNHVEMPKNNLTLVFTRAN